MDDKFNMLLKELQEIFLKIDDRFDKIDEKFDKIDKRFEQIDARFDKLEKKVDSLSLEIGALSRTFFKFESDTKENFDLLFETNKIHTDKEFLLEKQLTRLNDTLNNTTFRVSVLENSAVNS